MDNILKKVGMLKIASHPKPFVVSEDTIAGLLKDLFGEVLDREPKVPDKHPVFCFSDLYGFHHSTKKYEGVEFAVPEALNVPVYKVIKDTHFAPLCEEAKQKSKQTFSFLEALLTVIKAIMEGVVDREESSIAVYIGDISLGECFVARRDGRLYISYHQASHRQDKKENLICL